jgi:SAM-dependent methyltransferase
MRFPVEEDDRGNRFELRPKRCPTCGVAAERVLGFRGGRYHRYGLGITTRIVRCGSCGLIFPDPFPYPLNPRGLYGDPDKYFSNHDEAAKLEINRALVRELKRRSGLADPAILDVGSGRGELLRAAAREGVSRVVGLEIGEEMVRAARERHGLALIPETVEEYAARSPAPFDAVVLNAVLEHVYDPDAMVAAVRALTRPGAVVYIDIPNEPHLLSALGNAAGRLRGSRAVYNLSPTWPPYHVFGFNRRALAALLGKHGFRLTELSIWAAPRVPARPELKDRARAFAATQINRLANLLGAASNMIAWAQRG